MSLKAYCLAVVGAVMVVGCGSPSTTPPSAPVIGHAAPSFTLSQLNAGAKSITLNDLLRNKKPVLLNAFASWCDPCRQETPDLVRMASEYADKIQIIGVNMTQDDKVSDVSVFIKKFGVNYPVLLDKNGDFMNKYNVSGFPTTFLLDSNGDILSTHVGLLTKSELQAMITQGLGK